MLAAAAAAAAPVRRVHGRRLTSADLRCRYRCNIFLVLQLYFRSDDLMNEESGLRKLQRGHGLDGPY